MNRRVLICRRFFIELSEYRIAIAHYRSIGVVQNREASEIEFPGNASILDNDFRGRIMPVSNHAIVFDPYAAAELRNIVQAFVSHHNIAITGRGEWYPVAFFLKDERGEVLGGLLGNIWAGWLHVGTLGVAPPMRGRGFGRELMEQAEAYAIERSCTNALLDTFSFQARPFYEKLGYRVFGTLQNHPAGHEHYFMTKRLSLPV